MRPRVLSPPGADGSVKRSASPEGLTHVVGMKKTSQGTKGVAGAETARMVALPLVARQELGLLALNLSQGLLTLPLCRERTIRELLRDMGHVPSTAGHRRLCHCARRRWVQGKLARREPANGVPPS